MTRKTQIITVLATALVVSVAMSGLAHAQSVSAAKAAGEVGEQADGYLGLKGGASATLKSEVDAINIKRRAAYTQTATARGVTVKEAAAAVGCQTLASRVGQGQIYALNDGAWQVKGAGPITLPSYCAQ
jgi:uncharacterized protein YdbL (DUF1318 family)